VFYQRLTKCFVSNLGPKLYLRFKYCPGVRSRRAAPPSRIHWAELTHEPIGRGRHISTLIKTSESRMKGDRNETFEDICPWASYDRNYPDAVISFVRTEQGECQPPCKSVCPIQYHRLCHRVEQSSRAEVWTRWKSLCRGGRNRRNGFNDWYLRSGALPGRSLHR